MGRATPVYIYIYDTSHAGHDLYPPVLHDYILIYIDYI